jgi:flagellum-specific ATP synthase
VRSILDGHIVLSRAVAHRARFPAIDITQSVSRLTTAIVSSEERELIADAVKALALYEASRDLVEVGAYKPGSTPALDRAIRLVPELEKFMAQRPEEVETRSAAMSRLRTLMKDGSAPR